MKPGIAIKLYAQIGELRSTSYFWEEAHIIDVHCIQGVQEGLAIGGSVRNPDPYQPGVVPAGPVSFSVSGIFIFLQQGLDISFILRNSE